MAEHNAPEDTSVNDDQAELPNGIREFPTVPGNGSNSRGGEAAYSVTASEGLLTPDDCGVEDIEIPPFASEENKQLNRDIQKKQQSLKVATISVADQESRCKILSEHLENVKQEIVHTQKLIEAKKHQVETEKHMTKLNTRETGRLTFDVQRLTNDMTQTQDRSNAVQNEIYKSNERLDQFKLEMNWNQEELEQWALAAKQKEEDSLVLENYKKSDNAKLRDSIFAVEKLTIEAHKVKSALHKEVTETQAVQIELDRTADNFKELHESRRTIIRQWEDGVLAMRKRDEAIAEAGKRYGEFQEEMGQKEQNLDKMRIFLSDQTEANEELQTSILSSERQLKRLRVDFMNEKQQLGSLEDETEVLRNQLSAEALRNASTSSKLASLSEILEEHKSKFNNLYQRYSQTNVKLEKEIESATHKDQLTEATEKFHSKMENRVKETEGKLKKVKEEMFKQTQNLYTLRNEEATTLGEISGTHAAIKTLQEQLQKLDQERQHQQELLYAVDFQSQLMQRKVARVSGERTLEEKEDLSRKLNQLEKQHDEQKGLWTILNTQTKRLEAELRAAQRAFEVAGREDAAVQSTMDDLQLEIESIQRAHQNDVRRKEDSLVTQNVYKVEVARLRENLAKTTDDVYTLENAKNQLKLTMQQNEKEVEIQLDVLRTQMRTADGERHCTALQLAERKSKICNYESKYKTVLQKSQKERDGVQHSQAYYVIKAAQEQEELQRQGDELDANIRKAEREIKALENTLHHLVSRNQKYKEAFKQVDATAAVEVREREKLEEQIAAANELLFKRKKQLSSSLAMLEDSSKRSVDVEQQNINLDIKLNKLQALKQQIQGDVDAQSGKSARAYRQLAKIRRQAEDKNLAGTEHELSKIEAETQLESIRDQNGALLYALNAAAQQEPEALPYFHLVLQDKGLRVPEAAPTSFFKQILNGRLLEDEPEVNKFKSDTPMSTAI